MSNNFLKIILIAVTNRTKPVYLVLFLSYLNPLARSKILKYSKIIRAAWSVFREITDIFVWLSSPNALSRLVTKFLSAPTFSLQGASSTSAKGWFMIWWCWLYWYVNFLNQLAICKFTKISILYSVVKLETTFFKV